MNFFGNLKLSLKLPLMLVAISLVALTIMGGTAYRDARELLANEGSARLERTLATRLQEIETWSDQVDANLRAFAASDGSLQALREFRLAWRMKGEGVGEALRRAYPPVDPFSEERRGKTESADLRDGYAMTHARLNRSLVAQAEQMGFDDLLLVDELGQVVYSLRKGDAFAQDLKAGPLAGSPLAQTALAALGAGSGEVFASPLAAEASAAHGVFYLAAPMELQAKAQSGVVVARVSSDRINEVLARARGLGETGQAYLVDAGGKLANQLRFADGGTVQKEVPTNAAVKAALSGESGFLELTGLSGVEAVAAYRPMDFHGQHFAAVAEQNAAEVFAPAKGLAGSMLFHGGWNLAVLVVMASLMARTVSEPLRRLVRSIIQITEGQRDIAVTDLKRGDEVGDIARALDHLRSELVQADVAQLETVMQSTAFNASSAAMMMVNMNFEILYCNKSVIKLISTHLDDFQTVYKELDPDRIIGMNMDVFHRVPAHARSVLTDPANLPFRTDIIVGQGRFGLDVSAIHGADGQMIGYVIEWRDVTELRMQRALIDALDTTQCVCEFSPDNRVMRCNENFRRAWAQDEGAIIGRRLLESIRMVDGDGAFREKISACEPVIGCFHFTRDDGAEIILEGSITPVPDRNNRIFKIVMIGSDVTEAQVALAQARERNEAMIAEQRKVVEALQVGLSALSDGDLSSQIDARFPEQYEELRADFNGAVEKLCAAMQAVIDNAASIDCEAQEISKAAEDLSRRTEQQAATLEETAAAVDELTSSVNSATEGVIEADRVVAEARASAEASGEVVSQAVAAMSEIEDSSKQISKIISVIDEIAFQTNLLALNAGVEAARAGEAGRGFAVVASEVRALAQRSSDAAQEIATLITASSNHVCRGVNLVDQTGQALKGILNAVTDVATRVSEIAASSREQAAGLSEINHAMNQLDQVTQQNVAMFEETTAASHSLSRGAENLRETTRQFRTPRGEKAATSRTREEEQDSQWRATAPARVDFASSRAAIADGNTVRKVEADDWQDF